MFIEASGYTLQKSWDRPGEVGGYHSKGNGTWWRFWLNALIGRRHGFFLPLHKFSDSHLAMWRAPFLAHT